MPDGSAPQNWGTGTIYSSAGIYLGHFEAVPGTGEFRSTPLPPGDYVLKVEMFGPDVTAWYDRATSQADATVVHLDRGEQRAITFYLP